MRTSRQATNGLNLVETYFGERLDGDLLQRVKSSPLEHLVAFKESMPGSGLPSYNFWTEEPLDDDLRGRLDGELASETLLLDHKSPVAARSGLSELLLLAPRVVVADPIWAWAEYLDSRGEWSHGAWRRDGTTAADALVQVLAGLAPLREAILSGLVQLVRPPADTSVEMERLFVNPTTHSRLQDAFRGWGLRQDENGNDILGSYNDMTLMSNLDYYYSAEERWEAMARTIFTGQVAAEAVARLRRAIEFDDYTSLNALTPAPSSAIEDFFRVATRDVPEPPQSFKLDLPIVNLTLKDALTMRGSDEVFSSIRGALLETIRRAGSSGEWESVNEYASRLSAIAQDAFAETEELLRKEKAKNSILGHGVPAATGVAFGVGMKAMGLSMPGGSASVKSGLGWLLRKRKRRADAASTAIQYVSNVRLSGHL